MKKTTKKLLTLALSTLFIGAGIGSAAVWHNNAKLLASAADPNGNEAFDSYLKLEEAKIKKITEWSYVQEDGDNIWRFSGPSGEEGNPEIRFITDGTQTQSSPYTFAPVSITGFSFEYRMENWDERTVADIDANYIVQILASDGTYPIFTPTIDSQSYQWNTLSFDLTSECIVGAETKTLADVKDLFSGFVFKLGYLDGTFDIRNIQVTLETAAEPEPEPEPEPEKTFVDLKDAFIPETYYAWGQTGDYTEAPLYRFKTPDLTDPRWVESGPLGANDTLPATVLDNILINGKSVSQHNAEYKALLESGETSPITWTGMPANEGAPSGSGKYMQPNIAEDVKNGTATFAPIFVNLCTHGGGSYGNNIDMYIPDSYLAPEDIYSIKITTDFLVETEDYKFGVSEDVEFLAGSIRRPVKQVGEVSYNVIPTDVLKIDGTNSRTDGTWDSFLRFYPTESDYTGKNTNGLNDGTISDADFLKKINFFDYVLFDGEKMGSYWRNADGSSSYPDEQFFNVWNKCNSFATRWPKPMLDNEASAYAVQEIKILKGFQLPSATDFGNTVYEVQEDTTFVRMADGLFYNEKYMLNSNTVTVSEAKLYGNESELWEIELNFEYWALQDSGYSGHPGNANYFADVRNFGRQNILVNGVSLWDINVNTDDSDYNYPTGDWTHGEIVGNDGLQVHQNPTRIVIPFSHEGEIVTEAGTFVGYGETGKVYLYLHTKYVDSIGGISNVEITFNKGAYIYDAGADYLASETFTLEVPAPKYTVTVVTGDPRMGGSQIMTVEHGTVLNLDVPVAEGKTFAGWYDINDNEITDFTITESTAIYAHWDITPYTLTITKDGEEYKTFTTGVEYADGIDITFEHLAYALEGELPVDENGEYVYAYENVPAEFALQDYTINAVGTKVKYWLTVVTGNPRLDPNCSTSVLYAEGEAISVETPTAEGKTFTKWTDASNVDVTVPETMPAEDIAIYANWAVTPYTLTIKQEGVADKTFTIGVEYVDGIDIKFADLAYALEGELPADTAEYTYSYAEEIPAEFAIQDYTFTVVASEVVNVPEDGSTLTIPEVLALDIDAAEGYKYYVEGTIKSYANMVYGNAYIEDAEGNTLYIYGMNDGYSMFYDMYEKPWVGAKVKLYAEVGQYNGTNQLVDATVEIIEQAETDPEAGLPESYSTLTIPEVLALSDQLNSKGTFKIYTVKGILKSINASKLVIEDQDGNELTVYKTHAYNADWEWELLENLDDQPEVGEQVIFNSILSVYNGVAQLNYARLVDWGPAPIALNLEGETVIDIAAGDAENWEYVYVNAIAYTDEPNAQYVITWDESVTNLMVNSWIQNGGIVEAYNGVLELTFHADDFAALTVTVTLTPYIAPPVPEFVLGENAIEVTGWEGTAVQVSTAGEYVLSLAEGETNAYVVIETDFGSEMIEFPYTFTVVDGEAVVFIVMASDWAADEINLVLTLIHDCADNDDDHACDLCGAILSECVDTDNDHVCDVCGAVSGHADNDNDHACDVCGGKLSYCAAADNKLSADADRDHACDICGAETECIDGEYDKRDHACDICGEVMSECADADNNHKCDVCYKALSECADADNNHVCDVCDQVVSGCTDADADHVCDVCGATVSEHNYVDGECTVCGVAEPKDEPEEPSDSTDSTTSEEPADDEDPSILDKVTDMIPDQVKNVIPGCSGVVGGIAGGVAALGLAVVALLKKKEEKDE